MLASELTLPHGLREREFPITVECTYLNAATQGPLPTSTYRAIEILTAAGAIYLILTSALSLAQLWLERWLRFDERGLSQRRRRQLLLVPAGHG